MQNSRQVSLIFCAASLMVCLATSGTSQTVSQPSERHFAFECWRVAEITSAFLSQHGVFTSKTDASLLSIRGRVHEPATGRDPSRASHENKLKPWTDAQGREINDFKVYWSYADRRTGGDLPFGVWRLRLSHYAPSGEVKLKPGENSCDVTMRFRFEAWGANMIAILGVDSEWSYESSGRLEQEYLDGVLAALKREGADLKRPPPEPEIR